MRTNVSPTAQLTNMLGGTESEKAFRVLKQYWYEKLKVKKHKPEIIEEDSPRTTRNKREAARWEREKVLGWKRNGRLTDDGTLRLRTRMAPRTTARSIIKAFPNSAISIQEARALISN